MQATGAAFFVMVPALLIRIGHPSLCAHWLLLWALAIAVRDSAAPVRPIEWAALGIVAGLVHPYLAVMVLALLAAVVVRPSATAWPRKAASLAGAAGATIAGWWAAGLFSVSGAEAMATEGLGHYSMNLFSPITQAGWSQFLPDIPRATAGQDFEGFQYLGLGGLLLLIAAVVVRLAGAGRGVAAASAGRRWRGFGAPLFLIALLMAMFALSPRVTAAGSTARRSLGPVGRTLRGVSRDRPLLLAARLPADGVGTRDHRTRLPSRVALTVLLTLVIVQALDLHGAHEERRRGARDPNFYVWANPMVSAGVGSGIACVQSPGDLSATSVRPGADRLGAGGISSRPARPDAERRRRRASGRCGAAGVLPRSGRAGEGRPSRSAEPLHRAAIGGRRDQAGGATPGSLRSQSITVSVCVTAQSYQRWRDLAPLQ